MKAKSLLILIGLMVYKISFSQTVLEQYVREGFEKNQNIKQQQFALEKSVYALKEAKTLFLPNISFKTDYFLAGGGRTVDFPAGDLLNSVYGTLNQLTNSNNFPQLQNQSILLNPNNFYDAKFRTTLPLLNLEIEYNRRIKREQVSLQKVEIDLYKRELAKEIKIAYFKYLQSVEAIRIYESTLALVNENKRINQSLYNNDKVNQTVVVRADNEVTKFESLKENARQISNSAKAYFNFLLNKNALDSITTDTSYKDAATFSGDTTTISQREELAKLKIGSTINQHLDGLSKSYIVPKLSTFLDLGSQGFDWKFDDKTRYYFFGVSMQWDIFSSGKDYFKTKQVQLDSKIIQSQTDYVSSQLQLQYTTSINSFNASLSTYKAAISTYNASQKYYADLLRLYKENQVLFIELLDAQNQLTQSQLQAAISLYDTHIKMSEIERVTASFNINK
jgi:outer membrane protein TolC